jgi:hypothetical protein
VEWIVYDPNEYATKGMIKPFDLRASGGANNVWIAECGRDVDWGSFEAFQAAISAARVDVTPLGNVNIQGTPSTSLINPSQGLRSSITSRSRSPATRSRLPTSCATTTRGRRRSTTRRNIRRQGRLGLEPTSKRNAHGVGAEV